MKPSGSSAIRWSLPFLGAGSFLLLLIAPIGLGQSALARTLENAFHAPLCALVAIGLVVWLRRVVGVASLRTQYLLALLCSIALGALGELAQSLTAARHPEWIDLANDALGAMAGVCGFYLFDKTPSARGVRRAALLIALVATAIVLLPVARITYMYWQRWQQLPELVTWTSQAGYHFVTSTSAELAVVNLPPEFHADMNTALQVNPLLASRWVGVAIEEPWPKWSGYSRLTIRVVNPHDHALNLFLRVNDRMHNNHFDDRFNRSYVVGPRENAVLQVPLLEVRQGPKYRQIDLDAIAQVILFQDAEQGAYSFYLRSVRLER